MRAVRCSAKNCRLTSTDLSEILLGVLSVDMSSDASLHRVNTVV